MLKEMYLFNTKLKAGEAAKIYKQGANRKRAERVIEQKQELVEQRRTRTSVGEQNNERTYE